jgi:DNA-binding XRE family transcriptional regulator
LIITFLSFYRQVPIGRRLRVCTKGVAVPRVNKLKKLIRDKQAENKRRTGKHLSQAAIAVEMGIDPATLSEYMNDKVGSLNWDVWQKLADYFDVEGHEIFDIGRKKQT